MDQGRTRRQYPCGLALALLLAAASVHAQQTVAPWAPTRPLRIVIGFPPGSSNDVMARFVATRLTERLGQQAVIDNRPGASGNIGAELVEMARVKPDALSYSSSGQGSINHFEVKNWWGVMGPPGLPAPIVARYSREVMQMLTQPESAQRLAAEGAEPWPTTPAAHTKWLQSELDKWTRVAKEANIRSE